MLTAASDSCQVDAGVSVLNVLTLTIPKSAYIKGEKLGY